MNMFAMNQIASRYWYMLAIRGVIAVLFGLAALFWPGLTALALVYVFGAFVLLDGILMIGLSIAARSDIENWWLLLIEGIVSIVIGLLAFFSPLVTAISLLYLIAAWAIIIGILQIVSAFAHGRMGAMEWLVLLTGALSVILGVLLFSQPITGILSITWLIGMYAIVFGVIWIGRAFQNRTVAGNSHLNRY